MNQSEKIDRIENHRLGCVLSDPFKVVKKKTQLRPRPNKPEGWSVIPLHLIKLGEKNDNKKPGTSRNSGCFERDKSFHSKKSPTGPTERTPKPEYLIALAAYLGVRW